MRETLRLGSMVARPKLKRIGGGLHNAQNLNFARNLPITCKEDMGYDGWGYRLASSARQLEFIKHDVLVIN